MNATPTVTDLISDLVEEYLNAELAALGANNGVAENLAVGRVTYTLNIGADTPISASNIDPVVSETIAYLTGDEAGEIIETALAA